MHVFLVPLEIVALVGMSAVCSGLNIAFMSLDLADLRRKAKLGNGYAKRLLPMRRKRHLTLAAILLTNVAAVSVTSLVLEHYAGGLIAAVATTLLVVIFGEILPQAYFVRNAVTACGRLVPVLDLMIIVTYPAAKPIQLMLDKLFGAEMPQLHTRRELGVIISEHLGNNRSELDEDEVEIIRGALQLSEKRAADIMRPIAEVYWLPPNAVIDHAKIDEIKQTGHSRVPIYNTQLTTSFGVLLLKDLVDVDFDTEVQRVDDLPLYPSQVVGDRIALDTLFRRFIRSGSHLISVEHNDSIVGIVTIEDLLEEIVGREIEDETDRRANLTKTKRPVVKIDKKS